MRLLSSSYSGKANTFNQVLCQANLEGFSYIIYASGDCIVVFTDQFKHIQTIHTNEEKQKISALIVNPENGQISVCYGQQVAVYSYSVLPNTLNLHWELLSKRSFNTEVTCLCWGPEGTLFTCEKFIVQWQVNAGEWYSVWEQSISTPVYILKLSYDQKHLASVGLNDRLIKIWDLGQSQSIFTYLPHPRGVINMDWRQSPNDILTVVTNCADGVCRIWTESVKAGIRSFNIVATIDPGQRHLQTNTNPSRDLLKSYHIPIHWVYDDLKFLTENGTSRPKIDLFFQVQLDGSIVFWRVNGLDAYPNEYPTVSLLAKISCSLSSTGFHSFNERVLAYIKYPEESNGISQSTEITFLTQHPQGSIDFYTLDYTTVTTGKHEATLFLKRTLSGPRGVVSSLLGSLYDSTIVTYSDDGEIGVWEASSPRFGKNHKDPMTEVISHFVGSNVTLVQRLPKGNVILLYDGEKIAVYSYESNEAWRYRFNLDNYDSEYTLTNIDVVFKSENEESTDLYYIHGFSPKQNTVFVWSIFLTGSRIVTKFCSCSSLPIQEKTSIIGRRCQADIHSFAFACSNHGQVDLATFSEDNNTLRFWTVSISDESESSITWKEMIHYCFDENIQHIRWSPFGKIVTALYKDSTLYVRFYGVSMHATKVLEEFEISISENNQLVAFELNTTSIGEHLLALVFKDRITFVGQQRADELSKPLVWREYGTFSMLELSSRDITSADWTKEGLVVATGNQLWYLSKWIIAQRERANNFSPSLNHTLATGKAPLPHHHPNHLTQYMLWGKVNIVKYILTQLYNYMEAYSKTSSTASEVPPVPMKFFIHNKMPVFTQTKYNQLFDEYVDMDAWKQKQAESKEFNRVQAEALVEHLTKKSLNGISNMEQMHLMGIVDGISKMEEQARALDENGARFLVSLKLNTFMKYSHFHAKPSSGRFSYRDMMWALHSESQDLLIEFCSESCDGKLLWNDAKSYGFPLWINNEDTFKRQMELIGKSHYMAKEDKDPVDSTIYYLALKKVKLLHNLWKNVGFHKEKSAMINFLANDFSEPRWQQAALKNAFVLLGRQRYEYAAAFFLLGGRLNDAVRVCLNYLNDFQLAIAICRCYEGDNSPTLKELVREHVLLKGFETGDRWMVALGFWLLEEREKSFKALMMPLSCLTDGIKLEQKPVETRIDPASLVLLLSFKDKAYKFRWDQLCLTSEQETNYIWEVVSAYQDLGCPLLALEITQTWEFGVLSKASATSLSKNAAQDPKHLPADLINTGVVSFDDWGWDQPISKPKTVTAESLFDDYEPTKITADNLFDDYAPAITADNLFDDYKPSIDDDDVNEPEQSDPEKPPESGQEPAQEPAHTIESNDQIEWIAHCRKNIVLQSIPYLLDALSAATVRGSCMQKCPFFQGYLDQIRDGLHAICEESGVAPGVLDNILISRCIETDSVSVCFELLFQGILANPSENSRFIHMLTENFNSLLQYTFSTSSYTQTDHSYQIQWAREIFKSSAQWFVFLQDKMSSSVAKIYIQKLSLTAFIALLLGNLADAKYDRSLLYIYRAERFIRHLTDDIFELQLVIKDVVNGVLPDADSEVTTDLENLCIEEEDPDDISESQEYISADKQAQVHKAIYEASIKFLIHYIKEMIQRLGTRNDEEFKSFSTVGVLEPLINLYRRMIRLRKHDTEALDVPKSLQTREQKLIWHLLKKPFLEIESPTDPVA